MKIGIIAAMPQEMAALQTQFLQTEKQTIFKQTFHVSMINGAEVILLQAGVGKVNAALGATLLIQHFKPDCIINIGVAGRLESDMAIGDIIVADELRYHDVDVTAFDYEYGQMAKMPAAYQASTQLTAIATRCAQTQQDYKITHGLIVSGDTFITQMDKINFIQQIFPQAHAVDMESCAIAQICYLTATPFAVIRAISDIVAVPTNEKAFYQHLEMATKHSAALAMQMLTSLPDIKLA